MLTLLWFVVERWWDIGLDKKYTSSAWIWLEEKPRWRQQYKGVLYRFQSEARKAAKHRVSIKDRPRHRRLKSQRENLSFHERSPVRLGKRFPLFHVVLDASASSMLLICDYPNTMGTNTIFRFGDVGMLCHMAIWSPDYFTRDEFGLPGWSLSLPLSLSLSHYQDNHTICRRWLQMELLVLWARREQQTRYRQFLWVICGMFKAKTFSPLLVPKKDANSSVMFDRARGRSVVFKFFQVCVSSSPSETLAGSLYHYRLASCYIGNPSHLHCRNQFKCLVYLIAN